MIDDVQKLAEGIKTAAGEGSSAPMSWDVYHPLQDMYDYMDYLEGEYPSLLQGGITRARGWLTALLIVSSPLAETFPESVSTEVIGQSYEGRDMRVIKICGGGGGECGKKPGMYIEGGEQFGRTDGSVCPSFRLQFLSLATFVSWFGIWAQEAHTSSPKLSWCMPAIARPANRKYFERWRVNTLCAKNDCTTEQS